MEITLCLILGVWTLISGIAVVYRIFKDYSTENSPKGETK